MRRVNADFKYLIMSQINDITFAVTTRQFDDKPTDYYSLRKILPLFPTVPEGSIKDQLCSLMTSILSDSDTNRVLSIGSN